MGIFEEGSQNRHVASTNMNAESSRSHLVIGIIIESINKTNGNVLKGTGPSYILHSRMHL